ncbi:hypothetical protein [Pontibacter mangrovi]|uniref:Uncharacterized protein n=1 Tax=Pontibacter mangrovi TaxID=2589816 RepID=A0A501WHQ5_9BACT|nr:hypothetical protein [Pontibacter mangrovi]TPE45146.1 hypothetical protein FJM65_03640 [Pontibacter mangrovi]
MKQLLPLLFFLSVLTVQAQQTKLSGEPEKFLEDAKAMLLNGKAENAEALSADLEEVWNSGKLTARQQKEVVDIAQNMYRKRMRTSPHFVDFFTTLTAGVKKQSLAGAKLDNLLEVTAKTVKQEDTKSLEQFLRTTSLFMQQNQLFRNAYYSLRANGGSYSFAYEGASKAAEEPAEDAWGGGAWGEQESSTETTDEAWVDDGWGTIAPQPKKEDKQKNEQKRKESLKRQFIPAMPKVSGPVLKLENVALVFVTPWDSAAIQSTSGQLMLTQNLLVGEGGNFNWEVKGEPAKAELNKYSFSTSFAGFKAPDVKVSYPAVLAAPVDGALEWMSSKRKNGNYPYPKFTSFTSDARLNNLGADMAYTGGFSLTGNVIGSRPLDGSLSQLVVSHQGKRRFRTMARNYTFEDSLVLANRATVAIYQGQDSLTHPAMQLRYARTNQNLTLTKDKGPYARTPFYDSYHNLEITAERIHWNLNQPEIEFSILNTKTLIPVQLESTDYYSNVRYQQLVGIAPFHPLQVLIGYAAKAKSSSFYAADVARATRLNEKAIREAAEAMSYQSYLDYDPASGYIQLKNKAWHYVGASRDQNDYDHIVIKSVVPSGRNATLNLDDNKLTVRGVNRITFNNDTSSVYILPRREEVHILKNRDIEFDGQVYASRLALRGTEFRFNYDEFAIDLAKLDTIALVSGGRRGRQNKGSEQLLTSNKGGNLSGKLYINKPNNKSGEKYLAEYPKFDAVAGAQMAFARPDVAGGAYDSTVYFDMPPFKLDSLSSGKQVVSFDGTFNSGGIFPPIKAKLQMMPDETLGFYYQPPANGLPAYGGKGMVHDTIMMSSAGIQSKGKITYLSATLQAPEYTFYKNGAVAKGGTEVTIAESTVGGTAYPVASLKNFNMNWQPQADTMYLQTTEEPMKVYKEGYTLKGVAKLSPGGLYGSGVLDNEVANVTSPKFRFGQRSFSGNNAQMLVKSDVEGTPAVKAQDVAFTYDMTTGLVDFEAEQTGAASMEFPKTQYKTSMSSARWDMNQKKVSLQADKNGGKNWFYSMSPEQEGLKFMAEGGEFSLQDNTLHATGVPHIAVADTYIVPDSGNVAIMAGASMRTLRNATILADSVQQYHKLYNGNIEVESRLAFKGDAVHDYYNAAGDSFQLRFADFVYGNPQEKKKPVYTFATANMEEATPFYIFPRILYRGKVMMQAPLATMDFDGEVKLNFTGNPADSDWFPYKKDTLDPNNVRIPILKPKAADGSPLHTGLHVSTGSGKLYNTFVSRKQAEEDLDLFTVDGLLSYDKESGEFKMGREERAYGDAYEGNVLRYNEASNTIHFEGKLNLVKPVKGFAVEASGSGDANVDSSRYKLNTFLVLDMDMPTKALEAMAGNLRGNAVGVSGINNSDESMLYKLGEFIGDREVRRYKEMVAVEHVPLPELSKKLQRSLVLNNVDLRWSNEQKAWYSVGGLSLASSMKEDINSVMDGYLELKQDMNGEPVVNLYLQADPYTWYYYSFFQNGLSLTSSDDKFNKEVRSKSKGGRGSGGSFGIYEAAPIEKNEFLNYFQNTYLGGKQGFQAATEQVVNEPTGNFDFISDEDGGKKERKRKKKKNEEEESDIY